MALAKVLDEKQMEALKKMTAAVTRRRPKMADERRARIAALKDRSIEKIPGQDIDDFLNLAEDIDAREELVRYYTEYLGKHGQTMDQIAKEEIAGHKAEQDADRRELDALYGDWGGRDVILEATVKREELRARIYKFHAELRKNPAESATKDDVLALLKLALEDKIIEEGPGPIVFDGKPYIPRVEDDAVVVEFVKAFVVYLDAFRAAAEKRKEERKDEAAPYLLTPEEYAAAKKCSLRLDEFLDSRKKGICCLLPIRVPDRKDTRRTVYFGDAVLEKNGNDTVCRKVGPTDVRLVHMLFFYTDKAGERHQKGEIRFITVEKNVSGVKSNLVREAMTHELEYLRKGEEKKELLDRLCDVSQIKALLTFGDIKTGVKGVWPVDAELRTEDHRYVPITFHVESDGTTYRISTSFPGTAEKHPLLKKASEEWQPLEGLLKNNWWSSLAGRNTLEKKIMLEKACRNSDAKRVYDKRGAKPLFDLDSGKDGIYAIRGTFGRREEPIAYVIERSGTTIKMIWALPGEATRVLFGALGEVFDLTDLPHPTKERPITIRTILRVIYQQVCGLEGLEEVPEHLMPLPREEEKGGTVEDEIPAGNGGDEPPAEISTETSTGSGEVAAEANTEDHVAGTKAIE